MRLSILTTIAIAACASMVASPAEAGGIRRHLRGGVSTIVCPPARSFPAHTIAAYCPAPYWNTNIVSDGLIVQPSADGANLSLTDSLGLPRVLIEEQRNYTVRTPSGAMETRTQTFTREATSSEAVRIVNQKIDDLNGKVFGTEVNPRTPLESRVRNLENSGQQGQ